MPPRGEAQTANRNKAAVQARFDAWKAGTGNPFELLADDASWTIEGNSVASKRYPTKEDFLRDVFWTLANDPEAAWEAVYPAG